MNETLESFGVVPSWCSILKLQMDRLHDLGRFLDEKLFICIAMINVEKMWRCWTFWGYVAKKNVEKDGNR